ncbi:MAG: MarR family transcriptional regulator, partial [Spirochaetales bacterium]|nr:MarR family transcriptional regulator [Spirochaetales bacterium]
EIGGYLFEVDDESFYALLSVLEAGAALLYDVETFLKPFRISHGRFSILLTLYKYLGKPVSPSTIAEDVKKKRPTITGMLQKLVHDNLISEIPDPEDGRKKLVKLSKKGFQLLEKIIPVYNKRIISLAGSLSLKDKRQLMNLIAKLNF